MERQKNHPYEQHATLVPISKFQAAIKIFKKYRNCTRNCDNGFETVYLT